MFECPTYGMTEMKEEMPMIGDLVSFSNDWRLHAISKKKDYPYGIVTSIIEVFSLFQSLIITKRSENGLQIKTR